MNLDLARRFQNIYEPGLSFEDLIEGLHARQITDAALRRVLLHIVLHMKYYPFLEEAKDIPVPYARILGFSKILFSPAKRNTSKCHFGYHPTSCRGQKALFQRFGTGTDLQYRYTNRRLV